MRRRGASGSATIDSFSNGFGSVFSCSFAETAPNFRIPYKEQSNYRWVSINPSWPRGCAWSLSCDILRQNGHILLCGPIPRTPGRIVPEVNLLLRRGSDTPSDKLGRVAENCGESSRTCGERAATFGRRTRRSDIGQDCEPRLWAYSV
jgi:hypothetical protein